MIPFQGHQGDSTKLHDDGQMNRTEKSVCSISVLSCWIGFFIGSFDTMAVKKFIDGNPLQDLIKAPQTLNLHSILQFEHL